MFWKLIIATKRFLKHDLYMSRFVEKQGYRKALGGRWGLWEFDKIWRFKMWLKSECEHFPKPWAATHTEPLQIEEWN